MGQESDGFVAIRLAGDPPLDGASEIRNDPGRIDEAPRAMPVDGIHMGVDLNEPLGRPGSLPVGEGGKALEA